MVQPSLFSTESSVLSTRAAAGTTYDIVTHARLKRIETPRWLVNGQTEPVITIEAGLWYRMRPILKRRIIHHSSTLDSMVVHSHIFLHKDKGILACCLEQ